MSAFSIITSLLYDFDLNKYTIQIKQSENFELNEKNNYTNAINHLKVNYDFPLGFEESFMTYLTID